MRVVVTGGAGFIGSHIAEALVNGGHEVMCVDDLSRGSERNLNCDVRLVTKNILDPKVADSIRDFAPQAVFHHAAQPDVRASVASPSNDAEVNVVGTVKLAEIAAESGVETFVFASSGGAVYGEQSDLPSREDSVLAPECPYGVAKRCGELYLDYFARSGRFRTVHLRYGNVYGPRQDPQGETGVIAIFAERMLAGSPVTINGDGEQTRDYVHVKDVVKANLLALGNPSARGAFNVGTGIETSVRQLAERLAEVTRYEKPFRFGPGKPGEQLRSVLNISRARAELDWTPAVDIREGLADTVAWFARQT